MPWARTCWPGARSGGSRIVAPLQDGPIPRVRVLAQPRAARSCSPPWSGDVFYVLSEPGVVAAVDHAAYFAHDELLVLLVLGEGLHTVLVDVKGFDF